MRVSVKYFLLLLPVFLMASCSTSRKATVTVVPSGSIPSYAEEYLRKYAELAVSEMRRTGIPASITLAQGMLESDYGRSTIARKGNNHFGIKCHNDWNGAKIYHDDNRRNECFRSYPSVEDSYRDHSDFLVNGSRYRELFKLNSTDYKAWAHGLKKAGYATDPDYPSLLIRKIDEYGLHAFDTGNKKAIKDATEVASGNAENKNIPVTNNSTTTNEANNAVQENESRIDDDISGKVITLGNGRILENNRVQYVIVREGDTYESLAEEFDLLSWEISRYNELQPGTPLQPGQTIYLQPKRSKADVGNSFYTVKEGDTMYLISQKYAIKLSSLYKLNMMEEGSECTPGQKIKLR